MPLKGEVRVGGAKNSALPLFAAALLTDQPCVLENVPDLTDIRFMADILRHLGADVERLGPNAWRIQCKTVSAVAPYELVRKMRASVCLMGPMLGRLRRCEVAMPGGCVIGVRPIDLHLKGFAALGCAIETSGGYVRVDGTGLRGGVAYLVGRNGTTVTGTANVIMAAVLAPGVTRIEGAAVEPEVSDLCHMLQAMGARIEGVGSPQLIIRGVESLSGTRHRVIPDRVEAATFIIGAAMTRGDVRVTGLDPTHLHALFDTLESMGVRLEHPDAETVRVVPTDVTYRAAEFTTQPYPGFPTDMQAQMCAFMALAPGLSLVTERIYPNRFMHVPELQRMGADINLEGPSAVIRGGRRLSGAPVMASDLRASAALVLAGLASEGETWVQRVYHIDRGYERIDLKLAALGADIARLSVEQMPNSLKGED